MTCSTFSTSTAYCSTDRQFKSVWMTTLATLRCTNNSPGISPTISFAGTRLSAQPIHKCLGFCCSASDLKNVGSRSVIRRAHARLRSKSAARLLTATILFGSRRPDLDHLVGLLPPLAPSLPQGRERVGFHPIGREQHRAAAVRRLLGPRADRQDQQAVADAVHREAELIGRSKVDRPLERVAGLCLHAIAFPRGNHPQRPQPHRVDG